MPLLPAAQVWPRPAVTVRVDALIALTAVLTAGEAPPGSELGAQPATAIVEHHSVVAIK